MRRASHSSHTGAAMPTAASTTAEEEQRQLGAAMVTPLRRFFHLLQQLLERSAATATHADPSDHSGSASTSPPPNPLAAEYADILSIMLQAMQPPVTAITHKTMRDKQSIEPQLMSDLATTLQRVLRWKSDEADCIEARAIITPTIESQCADLLVAGFESFFPSTQERVAILHLMSMLSLSSDAARAGVRRSVAHALQALAARHERALDGSLPGSLFGQPDASIAAPGVFPMVSDLLLQVARADWHALATAAVDGGATLSKRQRPDGRAVAHPSSHTTFLMLLFSQLYTSLFHQCTVATATLSTRTATSDDPAVAAPSSATAAVTATLRTAISHTLPLFFRFLHLLFQHCNDLLDYAQYVESLPQNAPGAESLVVQAFHSSELSRLLRFCLPWLTAGMRRLAEGGDMCWCAVEMGNLVQSTLALLCRVATLHSKQADALAPAAMAAAELSQSFRGLSLRSMLSVLRESHQFTTTVYRTGGSGSAAPGSSSGSSGGGGGAKLHNILVPFAQRVLTGIFFRFASTARRQLSAGPMTNPSQVKLEELFWTHDEFVQFYSQCTLPPAHAAQPTGSVPPLVSLPVAASGAAAASSSSPPIASIFSMPAATPAAAPGTGVGASAVSATPASFVLPAGPASMQRSQTAAASSSSSSASGAVATISSPGGGPMVTLSFVAPSAAHFHTDAEFRRALALASSCAPSSQSQLHAQQGRLGLEAFLQWNLIGFVDNSRVKIEQLRAFEESHEWTEEEQEEEEEEEEEEEQSHGNAASRSSNQRAEARIALGDLVQDLQHTYATLLQQQVFPAPTVAASVDAAASLSVSDVHEQPPPRFSADDMLRPATSSGGVVASGAATSAASPSPPAPTAAHASVSAADEFVPRLLESEGKWTSHPRHALFLSFLDKFTQQPDASAIAAKKSAAAAAAAAASAQAAKATPTASPNPIRSSVNEPSASVTPPSKSNVSGADKKTQVDWSTPLSSTTPASDSFAAFAAPSLQQPIAQAHPLHSKLVGELEGKVISEASASSSTSDHKSNAADAAAGGAGAKLLAATPRVVHNARRIAHSLLPALSPPPENESSSSPLPQPSPMVPDASAAVAGVETLSAASSSASPPVSLGEFPGGELEEPARCLSSLFLRCLSEMGGGSAKKKVESWRDALRAEKAFAAACIKHNGLSEDVWRYSSSVAAVELLRLALSVHPLTGLPRVRLLSHSTCPQWMRAIVQSTFQEVRTPLLHIMRNVEEEEDALQQMAQDNFVAIAGTKTQSPPFSFAAGTVTATLAPRTAAARKSLKTLRRLGAQSRVLVGRVLANSTFLLRELDGLGGDIAAQFRLPQGATNAAVAATTAADSRSNLDHLPLQRVASGRAASGSGADADVSAGRSSERESGDSDDSDSYSSDESDSDGADAPTELELLSATSQPSSGSLTMPMRYRALGAVQPKAVAATATSITTSSAAPIPVALPAHLSHAAAFRSGTSPRARHTKKKRQSAALQSGPAAHGNMHESASSVTLQQHPPAAAGTAVSSAQGSPPGPTPLERQMSEVVRRRRHSVLTISPGQAFGGSAAAFSDTNDATRGAAAAAVQAAGGAGGGGSISNYLQRDGGGVAGGAPAEGSPNSSSSLWSSWSTSASAPGRTTGRAPYDAKWLSKLVHCGDELRVHAVASAPAATRHSTLRDALQPSIHRFQTVCLLRVRLLACLNASFAAGHAPAVLERVLPLIVECLQRYRPAGEAHLLHYGRMILRGHNSDNVLLHFYKHLVQAINQQLAPTNAAAPGSSSTASSPILAPVSSPNSQRQRSDGMGTAAAPVSYSDPAWLRIRTCLQLLNLDFLAEDTECLVGSGVFAALFRTIHTIDASIQAAPLLHSSRGSDQKADADLSGSGSGSGAANFSPAPSPIMQPLSSSTSMPTLPTLRLDSRGWLAGGSAGVSSSSGQRQSSDADNGAPSSSNSSLSSSEHSLPLTLRFASAYHLKYLCWQSLKYLTTFVLRQQQQRGGSRLLMTSSSNSILLSSVARQFVERLLSQLEVMATAPPKLPLQHDDGSLMFTMDCARMLCEFTTLKSVCSTAQLVQLLQLSSAAPASIQTKLVQLMAHELHRMSPADLDSTDALKQHPLRASLSSAVSPMLAPSSSATSMASLAAHFVEQMLGRIGQRLVANTVLPSLCQLDNSTATATTASSSSSSAPSLHVRTSSLASHSGFFSPVFPGGRFTGSVLSPTASPTAGAQVAAADPTRLDLPAAASAERSRQTSSLSISGNPAGVEDARPPFWHESGYQSWRFYPPFHASAHGGEAALVEELVVALRSFAGDRAWRPVVVAQLQQALRRLPDAVAQVAEIRDPGSSGVTALNGAFQMGLAALSVLGGQTFQLRVGALVEVALHGRRSVRGTVTQIDAHLCRVLVRMSPSQPHAIVRPYGRAAGRSSSSAGGGLAAASSDEGAEFTPAPAVEREFSFDQVRAIAPLAAPLLSDWPCGGDMWSSVRRCMEEAVSAETRADTPVDASWSGAAPHLHVLMCMQLQKQLVELLHAQLSATLSRSRSRAQTHSQGDASVTVDHAPSAQGSPTLSPLPDPESPQAPDGDSGGSLSFLSVGAGAGSQFPFSTALSPIPPSPASSPEPGSAGGPQHCGSASILAQLQTMGSPPHENASGFSKPAGALRVSLHSIPAAPALDTSALESSPPPTLPPAVSRVVDFTSFVPLLVRLSSLSGGHQLVSLNSCELEQSSSLFSRRLWEVVKAEQKHNKMWATGGAGLPRARSRTRGHTASADGEALDERGKIERLMRTLPPQVTASGRVAFVPFEAGSPPPPPAAVRLGSGSGTHRASNQSYRRALISALQVYFAAHPLSVSSGRPRASLLPRLLVFPLQAESHVHDADDEEVSDGAADPQSVGVLVVQVDSSSVGVRKDQPESKESATAAAHATLDPSVPRLLTLGDIGLSGDLAAAILPLGPGTAVEADEAEAEALELVLGEECDPSSWSAERWARELGAHASGASSPCGGGGARATQTTVRVPRRGHMSVSARRVIIGPNGQAAVLTSATPATSRASSPAPQQQQLQRLPTNAGNQSIRVGVPAGTRSAAPAAASVQPAAAAAAAPATSSSMQHLQAKFVRTTTHAERETLVDHIAASAARQSVDPARWQLYDFVDARDSYGDWYLAQIIAIKMAEAGSSQGSAAAVRESVLVHFFAWDDMYREWIPINSAAPPPPPPQQPGPLGQPRASLPPPPTPSWARLRPPSLFSQSIDRLESDRFIRKVKVFGRQVVQAMKAEREAAAALLARDQAKQICSIALSDAYSYPLCAATLAGTSGSLGTRVDGSALTVGTQVLVTGGCVELLSMQLGRGVLDIAAEYAVGDRLMVLDTVNKLCEAEVLEVRFGTGSGSDSNSGGGGSGARGQGACDIKIHYVGWPSKWDEVLPVTSERIQSKRGFGAAASAFQQRSHGGKADASDARFGGPFASWNGAGGHASQLIGLVGQQAVITKLAKAPRSFKDLMGYSCGGSTDDEAASGVASGATGTGGDGSAKSSPAISDTLAQVQLLDPQYGSLVCFWTRLHLLRRMDQVDVAHISLPGLLRCSSTALRKALARSEMVLRQKKVAQLLQHIIRSQTTNSGAALSSTPSVDAHAQLVVAPAASGEYPLSPTVLLATASPSAASGSIQEAADMLSPSMAGMSLPSLPNVRAGGWATIPMASCITAAVPPSSSTSSPQPAVQPSATSAGAMSSDSPFLAHFSSILAALPRVSQLSLSSHTQCPSGLCDVQSAPHNVAEACVVVHPRHRPHLTPGAMDAAERKAALGHVFVAERKEEESKRQEEEDRENLAASDGHPAADPTAAGLATNRSDSTSGPSATVSAFSSGPPDSDPLVRQSWLSERMDRNLNHVEMEKLAIIGSLVALLLQQQRPTSDAAHSTTGSPTPTAPLMLTADRVSFLSDQCAQLTRVLMSQLAPARRASQSARTTHTHSEPSGSAPTALASLHIQTIRPGEVIRLSSSHPGVHALVVGWTRSSQPNFEVSFVAGADGDEWTRNGLAHAHLATGGGGSADGSTAASVAPWLSGSPSPSPPPSAFFSSFTQMNASGNAGQPGISADTAAAATASASSVVPLVHLKSVPILRTGASPLILPNPCILVSSRAADSTAKKTAGAAGAAGGEDDIEAADDDFSILVAPYSTAQLETLAAFTQLVLHLRREARINSALLGPSAETSAAVRMQLDQLVLQVWQSWVGYLSRFHALCPWPCGRFKGLAFELVAHLSVELARSLEEWSDSAAQAAVSPPLPPFVAALLSATSSSTWTHPFVSEARDRYTAEKENWPLFSSYLQRMFEMFVAIMHLEEGVGKMRRAHPRVTAAAMHQQADGHDPTHTRVNSSAVSLHQPRSFRPIVADSLVSPARSPFADADEEADSSADRMTTEGDSHEPEHSASHSSGLTDHPSHSRSSPSIYTTPNPTHDGDEHVHEAHSGADLAAPDPESLAFHARSELPVLLDMFELILAKRHLFQRCQPPSAPSRGKCACSDCALFRGENATLDGALMLLDFESSVWPLLLGGSMRMLPHASRYRLFDELLNVTASPERWLPEFNFTTVKERALINELNGTAATPASGAATGGTASPTAGSAVVSSSSSEDDSDSTWQQLCKALKVTPEAHLRGKLGDVTWKARFKGIHNRGAEGLPGPFRQSLTEICSDLRSGATRSADSVLIPAPNYVFDTGLDRNKLVLNPSPTVSLDSCFRFGQLLGVAVRSQGVLDIDMAALVWKLIADERIGALDLAAIDYTAYKQLQGRDPDTGQPLTREQFDEAVADSLSWMTTLSDGVTQVELVAGGASMGVCYEQRHQFARAVLRVRLEESRLSVNNIRQGLYSVVPARACQLLTWRELELRVCGSPQLDLELLARHTVYAPSKFNQSSPVVQHFWAALRAFSPEEQAKFMQFTWARSRLPPESGKENTWRMKVNILEAGGVHDLPTAETCFFNLNLPLYKDFDTLYAKLHLAITHCSSINS